MKHQVHPAVGTDLEWSMVRSEEETAGVPADDDDVFFRHSCSEEEIAGVPEGALAKQKQAS